MSVTNDTQFDGRIGDRMKQTVKIIARSGPAKSMLQLATSVGPNGSQKFGYRTVHRCRRRNLIRVESDHPEAEERGAGAVLLTDKGEQYYDEVISEE
jgi:hypothetical protein